MDSPAIHYGVLRDALPTIGDVQVRNRGTVGGAVAHADPASDLPAALLALDAEIILQSSGGTRTVKADGFFEGPFSTSMRQDELLTHVILPAPLDNAGSAYDSLEQPASGYAMVGVAAVVIVGPGNVIEWAGIGVTGVADHPYAASTSEPRSPAPRVPRTTSRRPRRRSWAAARSTRTSMPRPSTARPWPSCTRDGRSGRRSLGWPERRSSPRTRGVRLERIVPGRRPPADLTGRRPRARPARRRRPLGEGTAARRRGPRRACARRSRQSSASTR